MLRRFAQNPDTHVTKPGTAAVPPDFPEASDILVTFGANPDEIPRDKRKTWSAF